MKDRSHQGPPRRTTNLTTEGLLSTTSGHPWFGNPSREVSPEQEVVRAAPLFSYEDSVDPGPTRQVRSKLPSQGHMTGIPPEMFSVSTWLWPPDFLILWRGWCCETRRDSQVLSGLPVVKDPIVPIATGSETLNHDTSWSACPPESKGRGFCSSTYSVSVTGDSEVYIAVSFSRRREEEDEVQALSDRYDGRVMASFSFFERSFLISSARFLLLFSLGLNCNAV
ncbi:hypothetical protein GWK47_050714 [Chionoecetes opilio]|uniref:Uncharacterized protein n=1 Tax=Chionoecetes opilio TaxID=41210 RepID=A0A8J4Y1D3_CHIOP|nr:hypothetical protein GWK47_050714 [Chionoecetes opilio]